jgi:hypothetical protein
VALDPEIARNSQAIMHHLLSLHRLSETFFAELPHDLPFRDAEWEAIEHAILAGQHVVNVKVGHLLDAVNALRSESTSRQWEGVVLGLLMARRLDLLSAHPAVEKAWVRMQAQQLLQQYPPDTHEERP